MSAFFEVAERRSALEAELTQLEHEEAAAVADLVDVADATTVADLVGWSVNRVRSAAKLVRDGDLDDDQAGPGENAVDGASGDVS